ncbi:DEBR0S2_19680g1_1 [Brettanomyces bruxellensis]|uniref:DEBR0S2_19680g1_1 n=1 Tax=Dekkera bruxellensis TaxID=5007 RepID=A0A7D9CX39_DEKBR|nr:DEBR0S2_19680g1_1 [Brettanomyces bruxellensis]
MFQSLRKIFSSFRSEEEDRGYSRRAFYNFVAFLVSCVLFSFVAQKHKMVLLTDAVAKRG